MPTMYNKQASTGELIEGKGVAEGLATYDCGCTEVTFAPGPLSAQTGFRGIFTLFFNLCLHIAAAACAFHVGATHVGEFGTGEDLASLDKFAKQLCWVLTILPIALPILVIAYYGLFTSALKWPLPLTLLTGSFVLVWGSLICFQVLLILQAPAGRETDTDHSLVAAFFLYPYVIASMLSTPISGLA